MTNDRERIAKMKLRDALPGLLRQQNERLRSELETEREKCARLEAILNDTEGKLQRARTALTDQVLVCDDMREKCARLEKERDERVAQHAKRCSELSTELLHVRQLLNYTRSCTERERDDLRAKLEAAERQLVTLEALRHGELDDLVKKP